MNFKQIEQPKRYPYIVARLMGAVYSSLPEGEVNVEQIKRT